MSMFYFNLMVVNDEQLPMKIYTELDVNFLGAEGGKCVFSHFRGTQYCPG